MLPNRTMGLKQVGVGQMVESAGTMVSGILDGLDEDDRRALLARMRRKRFTKGEVVFHEGDSGEVLHLIERGHVSVRVATPDGDTAVLRVLGPGDMFGEYVLITSGPRSATVTALDVVETMCLGQEDFHRLRTEHPYLDALLLDSAIREVRRLSTALLDALYLPVRQRVLRRLVEIGHLYASGDHRTVPISQTDLAGLAGVTRQTTNRVLAKAQEAGALRLRRGNIEILDNDTLEQLAR
jgi:CRP/FNR family transcriptional regulator, cyclic AMP receptor protein